MLCVTAFQSLLALQDPSLSSQMKKLIGVLNHVVNMTISYSFERVQSNEEKGHCQRPDPEELQVCKLLIHARILRKTKIMF